MTSSPPVHPRGWWAASASLVAAGWGSNQFSPLIVLYKEQLHLPSSVLDGLYGLYALGLLPTLLLGGRLSDRFGRRRLVVPALGLAILATVTLAAADGRTSWLFAGRLLTGLSCGLVFSAGVAWLREQSSGVDTGRSSRRATLSITAGFAIGPLVAGALADLSPHPEIVAYLPHVLLTVLVLLAARRAPDNPPVRTSGTAAVAPAAFPVRAFALFFLPYAPWVFATAAVFLAYLGPLVAVSLSGHALIFSAACATVGASSGAVFQPLATALGKRRSGALVLGSMALVVGGLLLAARAASELSPVLVLADSVLLGGAYGVCQYCGLLRAQQVATPATLGSVIGAFQVLSYVGFAVPYVLSVVGEHTAVTPAVLLVTVAVVATAAAIAATAGDRRLRAAT